MELWRILADVDVVSAGVACSESPEIVLVTHMTLTVITLRQIVRNYLVVARKRSRRGLLCVTCFCTMC